MKFSDGLLDASLKLCSFLLGSLDEFSRLATRLQLLKMRVTLLHFLILNNERLFFLLHLLDLIFHKLGVSSAFGHFLKNRYGRIGYTAQHVHTLLLAGCFVLSDDFVFAYDAITKETNER